MSTEQARDPRKTEPQPPFPQQQQQAPGSEAELQPRADHGEGTATEGAIINFTKSLAKQAMNAAYA